MTLSKLRRKAQQRGRRKSPDYFRTWTLVSDYLSDYHYSDEKESSERDVMIKKASDQEVFSSNFEGNVEDSKFIHQVNDPNDFHMDKSIFGASNIPERSDKIENVWEDKDHKHKS